MSERQDEWHAYYAEFDAYFSTHQVRDGCHPQYKTQENARGSIVLVHGLSDSPYFLRPIANYFYTELKYNVFLPLLHFHGLHEPSGMEGVSLEEWKQNVGWAIAEAAAATPARVSVGGLSTGGALSFHAGLLNPQVTGEVYLFSAALDLIVRGSSVLGDVAERLLRSNIINNALDRLDKDRPLVGDNPFKYEYIDKDGARELSHLIHELDQLTAKLSADTPYPRPIFAAHSEADDTANIDGIKTLQQNSVNPLTFTPFYIDGEKGVTHAGLVLDHNLHGFSGNLLIPGNVVFKDMLNAVRDFESQYAR